MKNETEAVQKRLFRRAFAALAGLDLGIPFSKTNAIFPNK
jgi:hypothetical protein